ncbi:unnamed protein product [Gordionus sp. m RMFG-2023]
MLQLPGRGAPPSPMFQTPKGDPGTVVNSFRQRMAGSKRRKKRAYGEIGPVATSVPQGLIASTGRPLQNVQDCDVSIPLARGSGVSVGGDVLQRAVAALATHVHPSAELAFGEPRSGTDKFWGNPMSA